MRAAHSTGWVVGTVVLILAIFAGTWFLAAGPRFSKASETATAAQDAREKNDLLAVQVAKLADQFTHLDEYKTELASLRTQIPTQADLARYVLELDALATAHGVTIMSLAPSVPVAVVPEVPAPVATADATAAATGEPTAAPTADSTTTVAPAAPAAPAALKGFGYVPLSIVVQGPYVDVTTFLTALQTGTPRLFVPTGLDGARQSAAPDATPPTAADDLSLTIAGNLYVLLDSTTPAVTPSPAPAPEPLPSSDRNPFGSLPGVNG